MFILAEGFAEHIDSFAKHEESRKAHVEDSQFQQLRTNKRKRLKPNAKLTSMDVPNPSDDLALKCVKGESLPKTGSELVCGARVDPVEGAKKIVGKRDGLSTSTTSIIGTSTFQEVRASTSSSAGDPSPSSGLLLISKKSRKPTSSNASAGEESITPYLDDEFDAFGRYIAFHLRRVSKMQYIFAKKLICDVLYEAEVGVLSSGDRISAKPSESCARNDESIGSFPKPAANSSGTTKKVLTITRPVENGPLVVLPKNAVVISESFNSKRSSKKRRKEVKKRVKEDSGQSLDSFVVLEQEPTNFIPPDDSLNSKASTALVARPTELTVNEAMDQSQTSPSRFVLPTSAITINLSTTFGSMQLPPATTQPESSFTNIKIKSEPDEMPMLGRVSPSLDRETRQTTTSTITTSDKDSVFQLPVLIKEEPVSPEDEFQ